MRFLMRVTTGLSCYLFSLLAFAQETIAEAATLEQALVNDTPQVGKHVMANMDAGSMILSLLMVLALIIVSAFILKRFNIAQQGTSRLSVVTNLSLGAKERVVVVQVGDKQLLLGVTAQQITLLDTLAEPLIESTTSATDVPLSIASFLSKMKARKPDKAL
jgi:flagellar protein FliO/FliZ